MEVSGEMYISGEQDSGEMVQVKMEVSGEMDVSGEKDSGETIQVKIFVGAHEY